MRKTLVDVSITLLLLTSSTCAVAKPIQDGDGEGLDELSLQIRALDKGLRAGDVQQALDAATHVQTSLGVGIAAALRGQSSVERQPCRALVPLRNQIAAAVPRTAEGSSQPLLALECLVPDSSPDWVVTVVRAATACGSHDQTVAWRRVAGNWRREWEYPRLSDGAHPRESHVVLARDLGGEPVLVVTGNQLQCDSAWTALETKLAFLPSDSGTAVAETTLGSTGLAHRLQEPFGLLQMHGGFCLTYSGEQSLDAGILERLHVQCYQLVKGVSRRVEPFAALPRDFVDEWLHMPWDLAKESVAVSNATRLQAEGVHQWFKSHSDHEALEIVRDSRCSTDASISIATVSASCSQPGAADCDHTRNDFVIRSVEGSFEIYAINADDSALCSGVFEASQAKAGTEYEAFLRRLRSNQAPRDH